MACFSGRKSFKKLPCYSKTFWALITLIAWTFYLFTSIVEPDVHNPLTVRWQSMNLHQILRPEIDTAIIRPQIADDMCQEVMSHPSGHLRIIIMVTSAPANKAARNAIRETWANKFSLQSDVRVLFIMGRTLEEDMPKSLYDEAVIYNDILLEDFIDSYENLTLKSLFILKWVSNNCPTVTHLLKTDDDMLIVVENLRKLLNEISLKAQLKETPTRRNGIIEEIKPTDYFKYHSMYLAKQEPVDQHVNDTKGLNISGAYILGYLYHKIKPIRDQYSKWFLPYTIYPNEYLPDFISGTAYVIATGNGFHGTIKSILMNSFLKESALPLEDVFITGIIANQAMELPLLQGNKQFHKNIPLILPWSMNELAICFHYDTVSIHGLAASDIIQGWKFISGINKEMCDSFKAYFYKKMYSIFWSLT